MHVGPGLNRVALLYGSQFSIELRQSPSELVYGGYLLFPLQEVLDRSKILPEGYNVG